MDEVLGDGGRYCIGRRSARRRKRYYQLVGRCIEYSHAKRLQANRLNLSVSESAKAAIIKNGADPLFGARPLKRYIQGHIESLLARFIIENSPEEGSTLTVDADEKGSFIIGQKQ